MTARQEQTPKSKLENFSEKTKEALKLAEDSARKLGSKYVACEHVLLGLARQGEINSILQQVFNIDLTVISDKITSAASLRRDRDDETEVVDGPTKGVIGLTNRVDIAIDYATDEARKDKAKTVLPIHLLIGLIREKNNVAAWLLEDSGLSADRLPELRGQKSIVEELALALKDPTISNKNKRMIINIVNTTINFARDKD